MMKKFVRSAFVSALILLAVCSKENQGTDVPDGGSGDGGASVDLAGLGGPGTILFLNRCAQTVWVGALNNGSSAFIPDGGGWRMDSGAVHSVTVPANWGGRFWGRTGCVFNANGQGQCESADCGGRLACNGLGGKPPASLVEFQMAGFGGKDFYDVSLVDGYNLPIAVAPQAGTFTRTSTSDPYDCGAPTCNSDLNASCPEPLKQIANGKVVGCRSAHEACVETPANPALACAQNDDLYRCQAGGPNNVQGSCYSPGATSACCGCPSWSEAGTCRAHNPKWELPALPETYAKPFKDACPSAYSFPYDDPTSTFTCRAAMAAGTGYQITFCP